MLVQQQPPDHAWSARIVFYLACAHMLPASASARSYSALDLGLCLVQALRDGSDFTGSLIYAFNRFGCWELSSDALDHFTAPLHYITGSGW